MFNLQTLEVGAKDRLFVAFYVLDVIESLGYDNSATQRPSQPHSESGYKLKGTEIYGTKDKQRWMAKVGAMRMWEIAA